MAIKLLTILGLLYFLAPSLHASATCEARVLGGVTLSAEQSQAIYDARNDFVIDILSKEVNGKKRLVIIAGETHMKTGAASAHGKKLLAVLRDRALEQGRTDKLWVGRLLRWQMMYIQAIMQSAFPELYSHQSTIKDAVDEEIERDLAQAIKDNPKYASLPKEKLFSILGKIKISVLGQRIPRSRIAKVVKKIQEELERENQSIMQYADIILARPPFVNLHLEAGHTPDRTENRDALHSVLLAPVYAYKLAILWITARYSKTLRAHMRDQLTAPQMKSDDDPFFLTGRNQTMARNINQTFYDNPDIDTLLAIVGDDHNKGLRKLLLTEHGFVGEWLDNP